jgi:hypothetical protein
MASATLNDLRYQYYATALGISLTAAMNQSISDLEYQALVAGALSGGGTPLTLKDEGATLGTTTNLNFKGATIQALANGDVTVSPTATLTPSAPVGQVTATNVQGAIQQLDQRQSATQWVENLKTGTDVFDEFFGSGSVVAPAQSTNFGSLGWTVVTAGANSSAQFLGSNPYPGIMALITATSPTDVVNINLGTGVTEAAHIFMNEWRAQTVQINDGTNNYSVRMGLHNDTTGAEPTNGFYFRYTSTDGANWQAVVANAGAYSVYNTGFAADVTANGYHRFRITCDGTNYRFYIDDNLVAGPAAANLPVAGNRYAPAASVIKTLGAAIKAFRIDYMALHYELAR